LAPFFYDRPGPLRPFFNCSVFPRFLIGALFPLRRGGFSLSVVDRSPTTFIFFLLFFFLFQILGRRLLPSFYCFFLIFFLLLLEIPLERITFSPRFCNYGRSFPDSSFAFYSLFLQWTTADRLCSAETLLPFAFASPNLELCEVWRGTVPQMTGLRCRFFLCFSSWRSFFFFPFLNKDVAIFAGSLVSADERKMCPPEVFITNTQPAHAGLL